MADVLRLQGVDRDEEGDLEDPCNTGTIGVRARVEQTTVNLASF